MRFFWLSSPPPVLYRLFFISLAFILVSFHSVIQFTVVLSSFFFPPLCGALFGGEPWSITSRIQRGCRAKNHRLGDLNNTLFSHSSRGQKSNQDVSRVDIFWDLSPWLAGGLVLTWPFPWVQASLVSALLLRGHRSHGSWSHSWPSKLLHRTSVDPSLLPAVCEFQLFHIFTNVWFRQSF